MTGDRFDAFPDGSNLTIQIDARTGRPVDNNSKLFELEIAPWANVDLRVAPRLLDDAARRENYDAESMLQPGGTEAITEFWNWINDSPGSQKPTACFRRSIWIGMTNLLAPKTPNRA